MSTSELRPDGTLELPGGRPVGALVFAHGAGGDADSAIVRRVADTFTARGWGVLRLNLPYRQRRSKGPPSPSGQPADRDAIVAVAAELRERFGGPVVIGGQSYGGRMASMVATSDVVDGLFLTSYPLHPPGKPEKARTEHLTGIDVPAVILHGRKDAFGSEAELDSAFAAVANATVIHVDGGHDLSKNKSDFLSDGAAALEAALGLG